MFLPRLRMTDVADTEDRGIDGGYSMVTLPQIRQTDSGPDRERQTAECKDPYQEAVKFSGGFMGRG